MAQLTTTKLNAESHLLLDQPLLRLPHEVARRNFKTVHRHVEKEKDFLTAAVKTIYNTQSGQDPQQTIASIDHMIARMQGLKRKMESMHKQEKKLHQQSKKRIQHLSDLYDIPSLADVKYDEWSKIRLNRLLVDYLLRCGYGHSARALAKEKDIEDLVDLDVFVQCHAVEASLKRRSTAECLAWCAEHKPMLKKINNNLEFELRLQQCIELRRIGQVLEAKMHAQKYIIPQIDSHMPDAQRAAGIMAYPPNTRAEPYKTMYSQSRWDSLAELFVKTHHELFSLPPRPLLHIALSAGLSALKTPSCHSKYASSTANASSSTTSVCPICSTELNELSRNLPYAHHTKSNVENDPVVLPNGRLYGRDRLFELSAKVGVAEGMVKDPTTLELFGYGDIRKVYIS